ncbi:MAG: Rieske (2Fe-2S) protein [Mycobacterium sp.]|nr:Rieske (2Fe-2S) protein [Actinomycetes bacterium]
MTTWRGSPRCDNTCSTGCSGQSEPLTDRRTVLAAASLLGTAAAAGCATGKAHEGPTHVRVANVPVGGGHVLADQAIVVVQPSEGTFRAFSAVCPHQGCSVRDVADGTINCACHGSKFDIADGSVVRGPARTALPQYRATVVRDVVRLDRQTSPDA